MANLFEYCTDETSTHIHGSKIDGKVFLWVSRNSRTVCKSHALAFCEKIGSNISCTFPHDRRFYPHKLIRNTRTITG